MFSSCTRLPTPVFVLVGLAALVAGSTASAQQQAGSKWKVRVFADWTSLDLDARPPFFFGSTAAAHSSGTNALAVELKGGDDLTPGVALEYRLSRRVGLELSAGRAQPELELSFPVLIGFVPLVDRLEIRRLGLAAPIHLTPDSRIDLWVAPSISYYHFGDVTFAADPPSDNTHTLPTQSGHDVAAGVQIGVDLPLDTSTGGRWGAHLGASFHDVDLTLRHAIGMEFDASIDPLNLRVGLSYAL